IRRERSVVSIMGETFFDGSNASGTVAALSAFLGRYCDLPAGLLFDSASWPYKFSKKPWSNFTGLLVQAPSRPLVFESPGLPLPKLLLQPRPCSSRLAPSGSGAIWLAATAPSALPHVCPPGMSARVSLPLIH